MIIIIVWEQRKLKSISTRILRKNKDLQSDRPLTISAQDGLVDQTDYFNKQIASKQLTKYFLLTRGDFAYNKSYSVDFPYGAIKRLNRYKNGVLSTLYLVFKPLDSVNSDFLEHYYDTSKWYSEIYRNAAEGARNHGLLNISAEDFFNTTLIIPVKVKEQNKIANLLNIINKLLSLQQRKLDLLKQLKKGLLQKMFADKDTKQPVLRFDGFSGDWEQQKFLKTIDSIIDYRGRTPKKLGLTWSNSGYLALSALNVKNGWINKSSADSHFGDQKLYDTWMKKTPLHKGQVVFTTEAPMGNVAQIPDKNKYILSQRTIAFVTKEILTDDFLAYFLATSKVQMRLNSLSTGGTAKGVSQKSLNYLHIIYPKLNEQYKISRLLKNVNNSISLQQSKTDKLTQLKKFLLQQMFI
ncbi:restriction endonuclease subunit S [Limosilactobacillus fastidiosus]|uniref:Restriction endonuclease subunit S n=1 Tax=Limosilactobacillus fastidiosus TaxID=2759855 RepID=A0A7W3YCZ8_9LACO|nr:restriction endonuclease subunit S [Limosilactobacillus fastidiosus]MBB1086641.1 restriction endonuclease subunit S [Limosilactobacillus fastidiosus]MCD7084985.1 restriction endonuclease subunit S [Limosilactobacillus fastidiosus]MCD7115324.1 restriction endonuclease subunit S [Limosilactobacillus fastidiosus]MCD7116981.1 restriction endonuclease subunit S [Limosilactobacillus fastidiosus]